MVTLMRDNIFRDSVIKSEDGGIGMAYDAAFYNALLKTIKETPALKEIWNDYIQYDLENRDYASLSQDFKLAFYEIKSKGLMPEFNKRLEENFHKEQLALYEAMVDSIAKAVGLGSGADLYALSKAERNLAVSRAGNVNVHYEGEFVSYDFNVNAKEAMAFITNSKIYVKSNINLHGERALTFRKVSEQELIKMLAMETDKDFMMA